MTQEAFDEQAMKIKQEIEIYYQLYPEERRLDSLKAFEKMKNQFQNEQIYPKNVKELRKFQRIMYQQTPDLQLMVIKEAESDLEYSDRYQIKLKSGLDTLVKTKPLNNLKNGMTSIHPQQEQQVQKDDSWTNFYAPMFGQVLANHQVLKELTGEEQQRRREVGLKMQQISAQFDTSFRKSSESLLEDIQQTEKQRDLNELTQGQREIQEISELIKNNLGLVNTEKSMHNSLYDNQFEKALESRGMNKRLISFDQDNDPEYQFALCQKKGK